MKHSFRCYESEEMILYHVVANSERTQFSCATVSYITHECDATMQSTVAQAESVYWSVRTRLRRRITVCKGTMKEEKDQRKAPFCPASVHIPSMTSNQGSTAS